MTAHTIAVLPFVNMSSDKENEYFSDGITEEIITALSRIENLKVTSRTSSFYFKNKSFPLKEVASQLGVAIILEGSVRVSGTMLRITAQLIQAEEDFHFWSETWDRKLENIFETQDEISLIIADKLREQFGHFEISDHLVEKQTDNLDAYEYSLRARYHFNKWNPQDAEMAIDLWEKVLALDPHHVESYVGLADAYGFMATTGFMPYVEAWQKTSDYTQKALALNPRHAGAHYQLANISFFTNADFQEAFQHGLKAVEYMPNYPEAQQFMSFLYILADETQKSWEHLSKALEIDPLNQETLFYKAYYLYRTGKVEDALDLLEQCLHHNPKNIPAIITKCYCLLILNRSGEALDFIHAQPAEIIVPGDKLGITALAHIIGGMENQVKTSFNQLLEESQNPMAFQQHSYLFQAYAQKGKNDEAFNWLQKAMELKSSILLLGFSDPLAGPLKRDPRYQEFRVKMYGILPEHTFARKKPPLLDEQTARDYQALLLQHISEEEPFLNPQLSLRSLAQQLQIHPNQLSWLLNEKLGKNFNEFINHYRVETFKGLATNPSNSHISLIGLAYESGFNSKTVFNTYFKKEVGMTPKEFLKASKA
ncbi:MAG TPA: adenylate cyclase [Cryomorphaceae bacterium]|nr:adenylate cyclase [Owenweeksia sp.]MBF97827.1 adenylate cyclase [Owenweeksia sp.]HAD96762.1 adenylate cyclase [Cryomorphaceae bacterium]HBF20851.1 adenylate cyclase [Cryomorphaceae bacterium]|tara:strand:+ start:582 stop:2366 length:1785 start_codon:yes stop_codon:yes gene_type:complete